MKQIRVSLIAGEPLGADDATRLREWAEDLARGPFRCQVLAPRGILPASPREFKDQVVGLPSEGLNLFNYFRLKRALASFGSQAVITLDERAEFWGRLAAARLKIPVIITRCQRARRRHSERLLGWLSSAVVCDSPEMRRFHLINYPNDPERVVDLSVSSRPADDLLAGLIRGLMPRPALGPLAPVLPPAPRPALSVIIPAYNEAANIGKVLGQLAPLRGKYNLELLVSDDGSQDGTPELAAPLCDRVITPRPGQQRGPGAARNRGALAAGSDLLLFIDADVVLEQPEEIIRRFLLAFQDQRVVSVTCAQNVFPDQARFNEWAFHTIQTWVMRAEHAMGVPVACGGCQAVRRKPFFAVGGYHQWLNMSQDLDMFIRVSAKGRSVYHHDLRVLTTPRRYRETGLFNNIRNIIINSWAVMLFGRGPVRGYHRAHQPVVGQEAQPRENLMAP